MQPKSDTQLLCEYAERGVEAAFSELVHRHTNLVYSAALRQVESPEAAAEITQGVFIGLAHGAQSLSHRLATGASLAGWLCRSARNLSLNFSRDEFRRQTREKHVMEQLISIPENAPDWERLRRVLDEAMSELNEADYDALVLRFFQNQDFRTIGSAIGVSDDTAQKRVARALEKLHELLLQRGIRTTAAALAIVISANAVQSAPVGLAAAISAAALLTGTAVATSSAVAITKTIAMTILQKALITVTVAALAGAGVYEARQAAQLRQQNQTLQQQQAAQIQHSQHERDEAANQLTGLLAENARLRAAQNNTELLKLRGEVGMLRQQIAAVKSELSSPSIGFAKMMRDPAMRDYMHQTQVNMIRVNFKDLFKELKLTPEQTQNAIQVLSDLLTKNADKMYALPQGTLSAAEIVQASADRQAELKAQMVPILGEHGAARLIAYSGRCRTVIPISVGQGSDFCRTPFRFLSDRVPGGCRTVFGLDWNGVRQD